MSDVIWIELLCLYLLSNFATSNKKISMKTKMIVVVVLAAMCVLPLSAQVKVGVEGGMNLSHYLVSGSDGYKAEQVGGMKPGFQLGVTVDYEIGKHWMLMSGLSWLQNRSTMKMMDHMVTYFPKTEIKMNNLILPLKMGYNIRFRITQPHSVGWSLCFLRIWCWKLFFGCYSPRGG